jgi:hypothetical protein
VLRPSALSAIGRGELERLARVRRDAARAEKSLPAYLQQELPKIRKERARLMAVPETGKSPITDKEVGKGRAYHGPRLVLVNLAAMKGAKKSDVLTVVRHELGHVSPQAFGKIARVLGFNPEKEVARLVKRMHATYDNPPADQVLAVAKQRVGTYVEELRAWRNAVRDSGGRIKWETAKAALASYQMHDLEKTSRYAWRDANLHVYGLKRYARMLRRRKRAA